MQLLKRVVFYFSEKRFILNVDFSVSFYRVNCICLNFDILF